MKEGLKLEFLDMRVLVINRLDEEIALVYIKNKEKKAALQMSINGKVTNQAVKPILLAYSKYVDLKLDVDEKKITTYQLFDRIYGMKYNSKTEK